MKLMLCFPLVMAALLCATAAEAPATFTVSEFTFNRPAKWEWIATTSMMRKAQLRVPDPAKKEPAEVVFFHFGPGNAGGTQANVERWFRQFQDVKNKKSEETKIGSRKVTYVQAEGTYLAGMPGQATVPKPNFALQGAIIESNDGSVFVKMTGPMPLVKSAEDEFKKMIESGVK